MYEKKIKKYRKSLSRLSAFAFIENIRMFKKIKIYYKYQQNRMSYSIKDKHCMNKNILRCYTCYITPMISLRKF